MKRSIQLLLAVVACVALASGCASGVGTPAQSDGQSGQQGNGVAQRPIDTHFGSLSLVYDEGITVEKNQETWALPIDPYFGWQASELDFLAFDLVRTICVNEAGFPEEHLRTDYSAPRSPTEGAAGWKQLFTVELAKEFGYRMAPDPSDTIADEITANGGDWFANKSDEFMNVYDRCQEKADQRTSAWWTEKRKIEEQKLWEELHPGEEFPTDEEGLQAWGDEQWAIEMQKGAEAAEDPTNLNRWQVDTSGPELQEAAAKWRACMAPLGIVDLPLEPWNTVGRPPESLQERWGWNSPLDPASADEIEVATFDAQCREDANWFDLLYEAEWIQAEALVEQHRAQLDANYLSHYREQAEHALEVIREYLPRLGGTS